MAITLTPQTEAKLKEAALRDKRDANALADAILAEVLDGATDDFEQSCAAIAEALAGDPADDISLEDYRAQFEAARQARLITQEGMKEKAA